MKSIINFAIIVLSANFNLKAQDSAKSLDWKSYYKDNKIEISYKYADCNMPQKGTTEETIYLKVTNLSNDFIKVSWNNELWYGSKCISCGNNEFAKSMSLKPLETISKECNSQESLEESVSESPLRIFSKFIDMPGSNAQLSTFNLKNITIEKLNN